GMFRGKGFRRRAAASLTRARADAQPRAEGGVHAHAERRRTVRVLRAELPAREAAVVDAHLRRSAGEARAHAATRFAARKSAVLLVNGPTSAVTVLGAAGPDAVTRRSGAVVEAAKAGWAVCPARALDPRAARAGRLRARGWVGNEGRRGGAIGALAVVLGDARHAGHEVHERRDLPAARGAVRHRDGRA